MKKVLITGAGGFLGRELCNVFAETYAVSGVDFNGVPALENIEWRTIDSPGELGDVASEIAPDVLIHAAFVNRVPQSSTTQKYISDMLDTNIRLFESVSELHTQVILISSSAVYGNGLGHPIIDESCPLKPISVYGLAKTMQEQSANYFQQHGMPLSIARLFNLCGPSQPLGMMIPDWVAKVKKIVRGETSQFHVKHRRSSRDFLDVRDAVSAIHLLANNFRDESVVNVANCKAVSLMEVSQELESISPVTLEFIEDESEKNAADAIAQCGSNQRIKDDYGWQAQYTWQDSLRAMWDSHED